MNTPIVLITGALTGFARATALAFAQKGAKILASGRHDDAGAALVAELRAVGAEAEFVRADVRHEGDIRALVDKTVERFGRLDIAVNAAGTEGKPGPAVDQTAESYAATFDTNVLGTILSMKHELRVMQAQGGGSTEVPFVAGNRFSVADITAIVTVDFATKALSLPIPEGNVASQRWYALVAARPSMAA